VNTRQACRRIRSLLRARLWGGYVGDSGVGSKVWMDGSVRVSLGPLDSIFDVIPPPGVLIAPGQATPDQESPGLIEQQIRVLLYAATAGDQTGEAMLMGHGRADDTTSAGRGLLEFEKELFSALKLLNASDELPIQLRASSGVAPVIVDDVGYLLEREYLFSAQLTDIVENDTPNAFAQSLVGGTVPLTWTAPDDTTDLVIYVVRRVAGSVPTPHPDGGTNIALGSPLDLTVNNAPGSGTFTYSLFGGYDEEGGATAVHHSDYDYVTVTVP